MTLSFTLAALLGGLQAAAVFALAPLFAGVMNKVKARTQKRLGAGLLQPYYDLLKLMRKEEVVSESASWVFGVAPWVVCTSILTAALFVPVILPFGPLSTAGDILVVLGLFALARFFTLLAGIDAASAFGGMGVGREAMFSSLAEPGIFLAVFVVSLTLGGTNLTSIVDASARSGVTVVPSMVFGMIAFFLVILAETGRIPFDNPATHLELTMVHEAMLLEYSGKGLALMEWAQATKQLVLLALLVNIFAPFGMPASGGASALSLIVGAVAALAKIGLLAAGVAFLETRVAKWRVFRLIDLLSLAVASGMIGMVFHYL